jgi:hypothetical protein
MPTPIATGPVHHLRLTVSDVERSRAFYTEVVGFQFVTDLPSGVFLSNGAVGLGLGPRRPASASITSASAWRAAMSSSARGNCWTNGGCLTARSPISATPSACTSWRSAIRTTSSWS